MRPILAPMVRHLHDLHMFSSVTSHELSIQLSVEGELRESSVGVHDSMHGELLLIIVTSSERHWSRAGYPLRISRGGVLLAMVGHDRKVEDTQG